jgi:hypothetical protein
MSGDSKHPLLVALAPIADLVGAEIVPAEELADGDVPLEWEGDLVGGFRISSMHTALDRLVATVERELENELAALDRVQKQVAIRRLDELGAFQLRKSIDEVADLMGVSRITIYNYLNTIRDG